jgi:hypothetical protein
MPPPKVFFILVVHEATNGAVVSEHSKLLQESPALLVLAMFCQLALGGVALGLAFGAVLSWWLKVIINNPVVEVTLTLLTCYLAFFTAETGLRPIGANVSGVLCVVSLGLYMSWKGRKNIRYVCLSVVCPQLSALHCSPSTVRPHLSALRLTVRPPPALRALSPWKCSGRPSST